MVEESATQGTKICVDYEPCKKTVGCSRMCPAGKKHRGACVVNGKMLKPDKMQTEDDEPKAGADDVLGADRVLREWKHPMQKFLEDAESSLARSKRRQEGEGCADKKRRRLRRRRKRRSVRLPRLPTRLLLLRKRTELKKKAAGYEKKRGSVTVWRNNSTIISHGNTNASVRFV